MQTWISNEKRKRKMITIEDEDISKPQKIRKISSYNCFAREFMKSEGIIIHVRNSDVLLLNLCRW